MKFIKELRVWTRKILRKLLYIISLLKNNRIEIFEYDYIFVPILILLLLLPTAYRLIACFSSQRTINYYFKQSLYNFLKVVVFFKILSEKYIT